MKAFEAGIKPLPAHLFYFMGIHFCLAFCEIVLAVPLIKLFEQSLCFSYYSVHEPSIIENGGSIPEALCKVVEIQQDLATIRGWKSLLDIVPVLLVAIPTGTLGDQYGRRKVMAGSLLGVMGSLIVVFTVCAFPQVFPLRLVWVGSVLLLFGGGLYTATALMWAMASEVCDDKGRSHAFYYIFSAFYIAELVASYITGATTDISPWIPCGLSFASLVLLLIMLAIMPKSRAQEPDANGAVRMEEEVDLPEALEEQDLQPSAEVKSPDLRSLISKTNILLSIPVFIVGTLRYTTLNVLIQYASLRFGSKISDGASFYSETALVNILLYSILVPRLTVIFREKFNIRPQVIDLALMRTCVALLATGAISLGLAPSGSILYLGVFIFSSGFGSRVSTLAFTSYIVPDHSKASFYAAVAILENIGHALGDPMMQQIFAAVMGGPVFWLATPFFFAAGLYMLAGISTLFFRVDNSGAKIDEGDLGRDNEPLLAEYD